MRSSPFMSGQGLTSFIKKTVELPLNGVADHATPLRELPNLLLMPRAYAIETKSYCWPIPSSTAIFRSVLPDQCAIAFRSRLCCARFACSLTHFCWVNATAFRDRRLRPLSHLSVRGREAVPAFWLACDSLFCPQ